MPAPGITGRRSWIGPLDKYESMLAAVTGLLFFAKYIKI
jgi:hypothetical protein